MDLKYLSLLPLLLITACSGETASSSSEYKEHSYDEVSSLMITYDQAFSISENDHFLYFYMESCHSCQELKNEVVDFALNKYAEIYFIVANPNIPYRHSYSEINETLGSSDVEDVFVGVTPQLVYIQDGKISKNIIKNIYIEEELSHHRK